IHALDASNEWVWRKLRNDESGPHRGPEVERTHEWLSLRRGNRGLDDEHDRAGESSHRRTVVAPRCIGNAARHTAFSKENSVRVARDINRRAGRPVPRPRDGGSPADNERT